MRELGGEIYYDIMYRGEIVMEYMCGVVSNLYRNCFIKFKDQNCCLVGEVIDAVYSRYPNPSILGCMGKDKNKGDLK